MSVCSRCLMIDCTLCTTCPGGWLFGHISAKYWRVVKSWRTCLSPRLMSTCETTDITLCFNINSHKSPNWEITCGKRWPPSLILSPASKAHDQCYDVSKMFDFLYALELLPETWLRHILSFIFNPRDYIHQ